MKPYGIFYTGLLFWWDNPLIYEPIAKMLPLSGYELRQWNGAYDNSHLAGRELLIDGHSLGGSAALELSRQCGAKLLVMRDPVKRNWSKKPEPKPHNVLVAACFHRDHPGGKEIPPCFKLTDPIQNVYRRLAHTEFITDPAINIWEHEAIKRLEEI